MKRIICLVVSIVFLFSNLLFMTFAHSGRTDASGGHRDNKNKSGLGYYHYHCGGTSAHLHKNSVCPYSSNINNKSSSAKESNSITSPKSSKATAATKTKDVKHIIITAEKAHVYEKSSTESNIIVTAKKEQTLKLIGSTKSFYKIEFKKKNDDTKYIGYVLKTEAKEK